MKKLFYGYIISFVLSFMLLVYEPILMYATNINDFWFDIGTMINPVLKIFVMSFLLLIALVTTVYVISKKLLKKEKIYSCFLIILFGLFLATYIQGNFLIRHLPSLDGSVIDWSVFTKDNVITLIIWTIILIGIILLVRKFKLERTCKYLTFVSIAIFGMLFTSFVTYLCSEKVYVKKNSISTLSNFNTISNNKNFLIFLVDTTESAAIEKVFKEDPELENIFEDFTFYNNAMSAYGFTRDSVPHILSGVWNKNETEFREYSNSALNSSPLFNELKNRDYSINLFDEELIWDGDKKYEIDNFGSFKNVNLDLKSFAKQEIKYVLYKYLPYFLKNFSHIESMDFKLCINKYRWDNEVVYNDIQQNKELMKQNKNYFQFVHTEGAHVPWDFDENLNRVGHGTYEQKVISTIKLINSYITRLKNNGTYDNSAIVILADHGCGHLASGIDRFNPILLIKGVNEHHKMALNEKPIMFDDLQQAYTELLNNKKSDELFKDIPFERKRTCITYQYSKEDHMIEYETSGAANDVKSFKETGKIYDLEVK